jgi:hypothetical protein
VEILLWLVPPAIVTLLAMIWVAWLGREGRGEIDRDVAAARLAKAMRRDHPGRSRHAPAPARDRSTGIAVRPSRARSVGGTSRTPRPPRTRRPA